MVRTDKQVVAVDGVFTAKLGEPLELVTMANGSKQLPLPIVPTAAGR